MTERNRWLKNILWVLVFAGTVSIAFRLWYGLGATTNLTDAVPWGLWKILNMVAGVALGTGGFTVAFLVYVLGLKRFRPLVRPAVLIAFLAYGSSCFALFLDIGLPHRIWHPLAMWNLHSFLFEVAWCVMLYFTITMLEVAPTPLEHFGLKRPAAWLHRAGFVIVTIGITLSSLHHTSLGSLFLMTPQRLHPVWYTPRLPVHFILSAMAAGLMVVVLAKLLHSHWYDRESVFGAALASPCTADTETGERPCLGPDFPMVRQLATIAGGVLAVALVVRVVDVLATGAWVALLAGTWESWVWTIDLVVGAVIPLAILARPRWRGSPSLIASAAACTVAGLVLNRLSVGVFGYFRSAGEIYVPSLAEWGLSLGVMAAAGLVFLLAVETLPIFGETQRHREPDRHLLSEGTGQLPQIGCLGLSHPLQRVTLIAVLVVPIAWVTLWPPFAAAERSPIEPPRALDVRRAVLRLDGNQRGVATSFPHADHQRRLGGETSCARCHHLSWPQDHATPCSRCHSSMEKDSTIFGHDRHMTLVARRDRLNGPVPENRSCDACHEPGAPRTASTSRPCLDCHRNDMHPTRDTGETMSRADGFRVAMHGTCIDCHRKEATKQNRRELGECGWCHQSLRSRPASAPTSALVAAGPPAERSES